ncbi:MAG: hypothetical protein K0U59_08820 [Gammaproteobacteria bacterium]|nr:hypothetical protein [Gammaproteobacteria bacterium]
MTIQAVAVAGQPVATEIVIRAQAKDAKFIGSSIGGAWIKITDADSGEILAEGLTQGSTGNTQTIMQQPKHRYDAIAKGAAAFRAVLEIDEPVFLTIEVLSPYIKRQARTLSQVQTWLVPGKPIQGDGLIVEVPGMIVDVLSPQTHKYTSIKNSPFELKANVVMMCGCSLTKGGLWDGDSIEVVAMIKKDGEDFLSVPLAMGKEMNTFSSAFKPDAPGVYHVTIYAYDPKTGNTGVDQTSFIVSS